jgi:hypothetical protein
MSEYHEPIEHNLDLVELAELEVAEAARHAAPLMYPVAEIPLEDPEIKRSENYLKAKGIIEAGIAASVAKGSSMYMVTVWIEKTHLHEAKNIDVPLGQYLGGSHLSKTVSKEEYGDLLAEYNPINVAYLELHKDEIAALEQQEATEQKLGSVAAAIYKASPSFESGHQRYHDVQSAAAHDTLDDE